MESLHEKIDNFMKKISTYDKTNWEIIVENYKMRSTRYEYSDQQSKRYRRHLIDLDLFTGKSFQKAKPLYNWTSVTIRAFFRLLLFPLYSTYWIEQLDLSFYIFFLVVYILEMTALLVYSLSANVREHLTFWQSNSYIFLNLIVGEIYSHVLAKNLTRPKVSSPLKPPLKRRSISSNAVDQDQVESVDVVSELIPSDEKRKKYRSSSLLVLPTLSENDHTNDTNWTRGEGVSDNGSGVPFESIENGGSSSDSTSNSMHSTLSLDAREEKETAFSSPSSVKHPENDTFLHCGTGHIQEEVMAMFFEREGAVRKVKMSIWDIVLLIDDRVNTTSRELKHTYLLSFICIVFALIPYLFESFILFTSVRKKKTSLSFMHVLFSSLMWFCQSPALVAFQMALLIVIRFVITASLVFLLVVAERTYQLVVDFFTQRYLYAKYFSALTSSRRAKRNYLPHFRLNKVRNIKAWLSLRSYLRRCGPLRSIDLIVSFTFYISLLLITFVCGKFLFDTNYQRSDDSFMMYLNWEIPSWAIFFSSFLLRYLSLGAEVNRKYNNNTELLIEEINLYLYMEISPQKKEECIIANNVLKLVSKLIKEIESPKNVTGFIMNPLLRNITRVVILSLISGFISEIFGVSFKFWKVNAT